MLPSPIIDYVCSHEADPIICVRALRRVEQFRMLEQLERMTAPLVFLDQHAFDESVLVPEPDWKEVPPLPYYGRDIYQAGVDEAKRACDSCSSELDDGS